ncbi:VOC family protein [Fulvivirgaceae bacterium BMA12]|uniref:VOC family protein n=1 Tax=Agaribacillus aureus TaxID=3051825 RepID=A0ABT8L4W4_9BACT|nr:VOC family protein [Fulvivirgaceae bacterium BMA12]
MANSIHPCLWFDNQAREAANFYTSIFPNSKIINDTGMVVNFELNGQRFMGLNGRNDLKFNEAVSIVISCENQDEIDHYWNKLTSNGGSEGHCGWCKDKYGLSWVVTPSILEALMSDPEKGQRVTEVAMKMNRFDIEALKNA